MIAGNYLQSWLTEIFTPCALVYSSESALNSIKKNNLTPADFIRPLGDFKERQVDLFAYDKTIAAPNSAIRNFVLDIYDNTKFKSILEQNIENYFAIMFQYIAPDWKINSPIMTKTNQEPFLSLIDSYSTPWYKEYEKLFFECHSLNDFALFKQPLFNICICSIKEEPSIINKIKDINNLPRLLQTGIYDTPTDNIIIVLNDVTENKLTEEEIQKYKKKFISEFKVGVFFWEINKNKRKEDESEQMYLYEVNKISEFWKRYIHKTDLYNPDNDFYRNKETKFGELISQSDLKIYKEEFQNYFIQTYLKKIIVKIQNLGEVKKQKSNMFSSIFKGKKDEIVHHPNTQVYKLNVMERIYINLGLLYFYFHNYDAAYEILGFLYANIKKKSPAHKESLKIKLAVLKFICNLNKKDYNISEEVVLKSKNPDVLIEQQLFIIKMLEHNRKFPLLRTKIKEFMSYTLKYFQQTKSVSTLDFLYPLLYEKQSIYYILDDKFRKFLYFMVMTGKYFNKLGFVTKPYALLSFSNLFKFLQNPSYSFINSRKKITKKMAKICNVTSYYEAGFQLSKNCLDFSVLYNEIKKIEKGKEIKEGDEQSYFIGIFMNIVNKIQNNLELKNKIDITVLDIPQIDDGSLLLVEENDFNIKKINCEINKDKKKWTVFNHYIKSYFTNPYVNLDKTDLERLKLLNDIINTKKLISNYYSRRKFHGNINQKLYVKCTIKNPLLITLQVSSIKLYCDFIPEKKDDTNNESEIKINEEKSKNEIDFTKNLILNEEMCNMNPMEERQILLNVTSTIPGKVIIKGISFVLFTDSYIIHRFYQKRKNKLYQYRHKPNSVDSKKRKSSTDSNSGSEHQSGRASMNNSTTGVDSMQAALSMQINFTKESTNHISKKTKIEYTIKDYSDDVYIEFPMGLDIDIFLYQLILFPMILHNTSSSHRIRRFSIFIENSDDRKIKSFYKYITKDIELNPDNKSQKILLPIYPINTSNDNQNLYIKVLVKCADEMRVNPIEVKRFIIKLNVKDSFSFSMKETYNNLSSYDKNNNIFRQIDFSLKTDIKINNKSELANFRIDEPLLNDKLILNNRENYVLNDSDVHEIFRFNKDENMSPNIENKNKIENILNQKEIYEINKKDESNNHIFDKFNKIINNTKDITIIFPWKAELSDKKIIIQGLYLYELNLSGPKLTKDFIREIFYNSTEIKIIKHKINNEKTFVSMDISFKKSGISSLSDIISQYDIFIDKDENPEIFWMGLQKYTVINKVEKKGEDLLLCRFNFSTNYKGLLEVNRINIQLYKKNEEKNTNEIFMVIKHITKPISIILD